MTMQNLSGQTLGQYELVEMLGFGGMGVAYRGLQRNLEREVAIKVLFPGLSSESGYIERFYREAKTAASLEHAHIVPVYDYGVQGDISYVVMRLLTGGTLEDRMTTRADQNKPLPSLGEVANLVEQLASALDYAASRGVIHRDIKPGNIMFDDQGLAYIVDFGIAKLLQASTSYTATGSPIGTPLYMPPEQWRSEELTSAADQYALAVTIYQLITGRLPFESTTPYGMLHKHLHEEPTPIQTYREDLPYKVQETLNRAMEKDPADRWESMTAFSLAFEAAVKGQTGPLTGFFEGPVMRKKTTLGVSGPISISISPDSPLVTSATQAPPVYKQPAFWVMGAALLVTVAIVLALVLTRGGGESSGQAMSPEELRSTVLAELGETQVAEVDATQTAGAAVAFALTGTADAYTPTPTPDSAATQDALDASATAAAEATENAMGTATQRAENDQATAEAGSTATQDALLAIAQSTADARATGTQAAINDAAAETQTARNDAATETQAARDMTATADARATATQDTLNDQATATQQAANRTATADARATATQNTLNDQATATQDALLIIAEATANARATGTQDALNAEATANAATATPTATSTPTNTPTPTATPTPTSTPTPLPPHLRAVYDNEEFVLINVSGRTLNISQLVFELEGRAGEPDRSYDAVDWGAGGVDPARMRDGGCYQLVTGPATQIDPPRSQCPTFLGWFRVTAPTKHFWLSARPNDTFTVRFADEDTPFATCRIGDGSCEFRLP